MSTRSRIGIEREDGSVKSLYCHYDGHPDTVGRILAESYPTRESAEGLLELGDLSQLGESLDACDAYCRDWDQAWEDNRPKAHSDEEEYLMSVVTAAVRYVYLFRDSGWHVAAWDRAWRPLG